MKKSKIKKKMAPRSENPIWSTADFKHAKPLADVLPGLVEKLKRSRGRPKADHPKEQVTLRLDQAVVDAFRAEGAGWQSRINSELLRVVKKRKKIAA